MGNRHTPKQDEPLTNAQETRNYDYPTIPHEQWGVPWLIIGP